MRLLGLILGVVILAACGNGGSETVSRANETSESPATTESPTEEPTVVVPAFPEGTARQSGKIHGDGGLVFSDVRVAHHEGFDRIVLAFIGTGRPGWSVQYVDEAVLEGSGKVVKLEGDSVLYISASGTTWPGSGYYSGPRRVEGGSSGVAEIFIGGTFEGYTQVMAGIDGDRARFRVFALTDPARLVVDVVDQSDD